MLYQELKFTPVPFDNQIEEATIQFANGWSCGIQRVQQHHSLLVSYPHHTNYVLRYWSVREVQDALDKIEAFQPTPKLAQ